MYASRSSERHAESQASTVPRILSLLRVHASRESHARSWVMIMGVRSSSMYLEISMRWAFFTTTQPRLSSPLLIRCSSLVEWSQIPPPVFDRRRSMGLG